MKCGVAQWLGRAMQMFTGAATAVPLSSSPTSI